MKQLKLVFYTAALLLFGCSISSCNSNLAVADEPIPEEVLSSFQEKFPDILDANWDAEEDGEFEVKFIMKNRPLEAKFDKTGQWVYSKTKLDSKLYPKTILAMVDSVFPEYDIEKIDAYETPNGTSHRVKLGNELYQIQFKVDEQGEIVVRRIESD